jgi:nucleoside-diphosphate-sugar epimerase
VLVENNNGRGALDALEGSEGRLEEALSHPTPALVDAIKTFSSPLLVLGAGGKMGPTLCLMARRAAGLAGHPLEIVAVSRFSDPAARASLEKGDIRTVACDLLDRGAVAALPESRNIIYMVGLKFGTAANPSLTWAMNTLVPAHVCERFPNSRIVALSTGNVYPLSDVSRGGATEDAPLTPLGEYPNAAVARERIFEFHSRRNGTQIALLRLIYAVEARYGVLADIAGHVHRGEPVPLATGYFNCVWQGDANDMTLRSLRLTSSPPAIFNLCRPEAFSVRAVATRLGELLGREPQFTGVESQTALLGSAARITHELGSPAVSLDSMLRAVAAWVKEGGRDLGRPTHFAVRDGGY